MSTLSKLTGADAAHNAGVSSNAALSQQQIGNQYGNQAAGIYNNLNSQGQAQSGTYNQDYLGLIAKQGNLAGLGSNVLSPAAQQAGGNPRAADANGAANPTAQGGAQQQQQNASDPYSLDQNQQKLLNQQLQGIAQQQQAAVASTTQALAQQGITGGAALAAAQQTIQEHFADLNSRTQVSFYEQISKDKQAALQSIVQEIAQYGQQGNQLQQSAATGFGGLQAGAFGQQNSLNQQAVQQQNLSQEQFGGLLGLIDTGLTGGFNKPSSPSSSAASARFGTPRFTPSYPNTRPGLFTQRPGDNGSGSHRGVHGDESSRFRVDGAVEG